MDDYIAINPIILQSSLVFDHVTQRMYAQQHAVSAHSYPLS